MRMLTVLFATALLSACASAPAPAPVSKAAAAEAPAKAGAAAAADGSFVPPAGYRARKRGSTTVYCKTDTPVGTRFGTEYCYTQGDLERMEASRVNTKQEIDRVRRTCTGGGCGGG